MAIACKICIMKVGLKGSEIDRLPQTEEEQIAHMEKVHHMPVRRKGETEEQVIKRFLEKYPEARNCSECRKNGAEWVTVMEGE